MSETRTLEQKRAFLCEAGFFVGSRDPRLNTNYAGTFMVVDENFEEVLAAAGGTTPDGSQGPWCVVGDDLDLLVEEAYEWWLSAAEENAP